jgi:hypothetical protein
MKMYLASKYSHRSALGGGREPLNLSLPPNR